MSQLTLPEVGEIVRKVRKERGLRLEDLADDNISPATISNLERGASHVRPEKMSYLLEKLDIPLEKLPEMLLTEQEELKSIRFKLFACESLRTLDEPDQALTMLKELNIDDSHPCAALSYYIKGKCHSSKGEWKSAERAFSEAVRLSSQTPTDLEAAAFNELSLCSFYQNDLKQALQFTDSGIAAFQNRGDRPQIKYILRRNKAIYLQRLGRFGEAYQVIHDVWDRLPEIEHMDTKLSFYWLRAELSRQMEVLDQAIQYAEIGLELARLNKHYKSMFDFWSLLASVYMERGDLEKAEDCFHMISRLENKVSEQDEDKFITAYARLGVLYMKQNRKEAAREAMQKAVQLGKKHNDASRLTYALQVLGDFYRLQDQKVEAIPYYREELQVAEKYGLKKTAYQAMFHLSQCLEEVDRQEFERMIRNMYNVQVEIHQEEESNFR